MENPGNQIVETLPDGDEIITQICPVCGEVFYGDWVDCEQCHGRGCAACNHTGGSFQCCNRKNHPEEGENGKKS